jgi:hypothetical protein
MQVWLCKPIPARKHVETSVKSFKLKKRVHLHTVHVNVINTTKSPPAFATRMTRE